MKKIKTYVYNYKKIFKKHRIFNEDVDINWNNFINQEVIIFGNLPYNISAKLLINWIKLSSLNQIFKRFILMFQKEVADRILVNGF